MKTVGWRLLVAYLALALVVFGLGPATADAGRAAQEQWLCQDLGRSPWSAGQRAANFSGNLAAVSTGLPYGTLAVATSDVRAREFRLWLYDRVAGDRYITVRYDDVVVEPGTELPTGRIDPVGNLLLVYDQGMLKILFVAWNGGSGGPQPLIRVYTWCGAVDLQ